VISLNCRPALLVEDFDTRLIEDRGVKNRVKRLGVTGGGFLSFLGPWCDIFSGKTFSWSSMLLVFSKNARDKVEDMG
jgi:hypothetical protein